LFLYTDGVTEAFNKNEEAFGEERLEAYLKAHSTQPINDIVTNLFQETNSFSAGVPQSDDITLLTIRYAGKP
jgi:sigma-B regulation protein RsbU (phosphoserine phosphatase)